MSDIQMTFNFDGFGFAEFLISLKFDLRFSFEHAY